MIMFGVLLIVCINFFVPDMFLCIRVIDSVTFLRGAGILDGEKLALRRGDGTRMSETSCDTTLLHSTNRRLYILRNSSKSMPETHFIHLNQNEIEALLKTFDSNSIEILPLIQRGKIKLVKNIVNFFFLQNSIKIQNQHVLICSIKIQTFLWSIDLQFN